AAGVGLKGHFLWVTFLLGQQKKSDSSVGRRSKRPLTRSGLSHRYAAGVGLKGHFLWVTFLLGQQKKS
ncbi:hypothetical protein, partial [Aeromonas veronii]|uniref:hypothetical protein n=1 Tax=Aeromonas veronii TaxID=654 RepID=UPI001F16EECE